jgi:DNA-binding transcriptional ArsR family regulator
MPENTATQYLRALQARGLLAARRQSRWVYYVAQADRSVQHAESMLAAMQDAFTGGVTVAEMVRDLTAFTHARRIDIVRRLAMRPAIAEQIAHDTLMSVPACYRHLTKLQARGVVVETRDSKFELGTLRRRLAVQLLHAALE